MLGREEMSEYERQREERIREQNQMLRELGIGLGVSPAPLVVPIVKPAPTRKRRRVAEEAPVEQEQKVATRFSLRARGLKADVSAEDSAAKSPQLALDSFKQSRVQGDIPFSFQDGHVFDSLKKLILEHPSNEGQNNSVSELNRLRSPIEGSVKVTKEMIFSIAFHPSKEKILAFVGDKLGDLVLWNISDTIEQGQEIQEKIRNGVEVDELVPMVCNFKPFQKPISKILFQQNSCGKLLLSSYDGSVRLMDIEKQKFEDVFIHPEQDEMISHFDIEQNSSVLWISDGSGSAICSDLRSPSTTIFQLSAKKINTIHLNPVNQQYLCIGGLDRTVKLFDVRNMKLSGDMQDEAPLIEPLMVLPHNLSVNAAYWDPKGLDIISTSFDDTLGLWKNVLKKRESGLIKIRHNNQTGRWVQKFKAVWMGQDACYFGSGTPTSQASSLVIGNMQRTVDIYSGNNGSQAASLQEISLTAIPAVNVFHPYLPLIASGNASGRMNIWC